MAESLTKFHKLSDLVETRKAFMLRVSLFACELCSCLEHGEFQWKECSAMPNKGNCLHVSDRTSIGHGFRLSELLNRCLC